MNAPVRNLDAVRTRRWSAREDAVLRALYPRAEWRELRAALPSRSHKAIWQRAGALGVARQVRPRPPWTTHEDALLRRMFATATWDELAAALPRHSVSAISQRATMHKLRRPGRTPRQARYGLLRQLREARRARSMTIAGLAERIGVAPISLQRWEIGRATPSLPLLIDWAQALGYELTLHEREARA